MKTTTIARAALGSAVLMAASMGWSATISGTTDVGSLDELSGISQRPTAVQQMESRGFSLPELGSLPLLAAGVLGLVAARRLVNRKV